MVMRRAAMPQAPFHLLQSRQPHTGGQPTLTHPLASYCPVAGHRIPSRAGQTRQPRPNVAGQDEAIVLIPLRMQVAPSIA